MRRLRRRLTVLCAVLLAVAAGTALFRVSQQVQNAEDDMRRLETAVTGEREAIRVLNAEWDYLNRPDRLEELSKEYLRMQQPQAKQMEASADDLPATPAAPELRVQPAVMEAKQPATVPSTAAKPQKKPASQRDFNRLLSDLAPAAGGAR